MSSDVQSILQVIFTGNKVSLAMVTVVVYDYILTFPREVEYVWNKPWTWVSTLFLVVRYCGIYSAIQESLMGTTFIPGPLTMCTRFQYSAQWAYMVFISASDLLMVLRVYALWNRSKIILSILLVFYTAQVAMQLVGTALWGNPYTQDATVAISQVLDYSVCQETLTVIGPDMKYIVIQPTVFYVLLLTLALVPTAKQSIAMYKATKQWQPNRYMSLIVREGVFYLFLNMINNLAILIELADTSPLPSVWYMIFSVFATIIEFPFFPRFVLSIRELYEKDSRGRLEGIDTGFGVSSRVGNVVGQNTIVSAIAFADSGNGQKEGDEEIQLEPAGERNDERHPV